MRPTRQTPSNQLLLSFRGVIKSGCEEEFEAWVDGIGQAAMQYEGHLGLEVIRPTDHSHPEYVIIFRFDNYSNLKKWELSDTRREWLERAEPLAASEAKVRIITGLEFWFTPPEASGAPKAPPYKQGLATWLGLYPLVMILNLLLNPLLAPLPLAIRNLIMTFLVVLFMTYVVMPRVTRFLASWLYKQ